MNARPASTTLHASPAQGLAASTRMLCAEGGLPPSRPAHPRKALLPRQGTNSSVCRKACASRRKEPPSPPTHRLHCSITQGYTAHACMSHAGRRTRLVAPSCPSRRAPRRCRRTPATRPRRPQSWPAARQRFTVASLAGGTRRTAQDALLAPRPCAVQPVQSTSVTKPSCKRRAPVHYPTRPATKRFCHPPDFRSPLPQCPARRRTGTWAGTPPTWTSRARWRTRG
jgi:hypothetical protein